MVDTAGTLCKAATALMERGANSVSAYVVHAVLSGSAVDNITNSVLKEVIVTDSIPQTKAIKECTKIRTITIANILGETIRRINQDESVTSLMNH